MFSRTRTSTPGKGARRSTSFSVIGPDVVVTGDLVTNENLQVSGRIDGDVRCAALHLAEGGAIAGNVVADEARLAGRVDGTLAAGTVAVEASAQLTGEVSYATLSIESGARVDGRFVHRAPPAEEEPVSGGIPLADIFPHDDAVGAA